MSDIIYKEESYAIMGAAFEVYKEKGNGYLEAVYQECLAMEFEDQNIPFEEKPPLCLCYKNRPLKKKYEPDFFCFDKIVVEIKAVSTLTDEHRKQTLNYLKSTGKELGLLINFGSHPKVQYERFVNKPDGKLSR